MIQMNAYEMEAHTIGFEDAKHKIEYRADILYPPSGHERDTSFTDELNYQYYVGYHDYEGDIGNE